jgi:hypothetical protein
MSHGINEFLATIHASNSLMRNNQFELTIESMPAWAASSGFNGYDVKFFCSQANEPGVNVDSIDHRPYGVGTLEYYPTGVSFFDLQTTFYADANGKLIKFFHTWIRNIFAFDESMGPENKFMVQYRDKYISQIKVTRFNEQGGPVLEWVYVDAFPVNIQPIAVRWENNQEVTQFEIIWKYRTYKEKSISGATVDNIFSSTTMPGTGLPGFSTSLLSGVNGIVGRSTGVVDSLVKFVSTQNPAFVNGINGGSNLISKVQNAVGSVQAIQGNIQNIRSSTGNIPSLIKSKLPSLPKIF